MEQNKGLESKDQKVESNQKIYIQRFDSYSRFLHILVITSFLTLALTGMVIKFSGVGIFQFISSIMGGYEVTGFLHRAAAIITFTYFFLHLFYILKKWLIDKRGMKHMITGENSMVPRLLDVKLRLYYPE